MHRRTVIKAAGAGLIAVAAAGGGLVLMTPRDARRAGAPPRVLDATESQTLEALGEVLLPGARTAGISPFVDSQLAAAPADSLLMLRYFDWPAPYAPFYKGGLKALDAASQTAFGKPFKRLAHAQSEQLVGGLGAGQVKGWTGPPAPLFYLAVRSDAVDVVYGTMEGFKALDVPYMAHIEPPTRW